MKGWKLKVSLVVALVAASSGLVPAQNDQTINDKDIKVLQFEDLTYPRVVQVAHIQGVVVVRVRLDSQGKVLDASALAGNPILTKICVENAQNSAILVYEFRIEGVCGQREASQMIFHPPNFASITGCAITVQPTRE